jgi:glycosyltransferase involved in cell wall biosynthesis
VYQIDRKEIALEPSLSVLLPVRNAQKAIASQIAELLDLLPELTERFEILVIDDASTDETAQVARELSIEYPQVRVICHEEPRGLDSAVASGMNHSTAEVVLVQESRRRPNFGELQRLWSLRNDRSLVMASSRMSAPQWLDRLMGWGRSIAHASATTANAPSTTVPESGLRMIRRDGIAQWHVTRETAEASASGPEM